MFDSFKPFFLSEIKVKKICSLTRGTHPNMFCSSMLRDGTAVENRCGCTDHRVESLFFRMPPPARTRQWTSTHSSAHTVRELREGTGLVAAVSCRMFTGQNKSWGERFLFLCFTWLGSIQQVVAHLSYLFAAEGREVENGVLRQGWGSLFSQQDHLGQLSEPGLNIARRWANGTAGLCVWVQSVDVGRCMWTLFSWNWCKCTVRGVR